MKRNMIQKTLLLVLAGFLFASTQSHAFVMSDGNKTIVIKGDDGLNNQEFRIRRLERAVRDLQDQVAYLSGQGISQDLYVCSIRVFTKLFKSDKQKLEYDAQEQAKSLCQKENHPMHCENVECKKIN